MRPHKRKILLIGLVLLAAGLFCAWYFGVLTKKEQKYSLIYIPKVVDGTNDFWSSLISGTQNAAAEYGAEIEIVAPDREQDVEKQNELLQWAIEQKPDALLMSPSSFTESTELLKEAKDKGIPVIFIDSYINEEVQDLTVATDNLEAGRLLGEYAASLLSETGKIAVVGHVQGVSTAVERELGFREGLGDREENIVDVVFCDSLFEKAYSLTKELMEKYPDLEMIAGLNEYSSVGAARAVKAAGAQDRIKVVGIDSSQEAVQLMEQDVFQGLVIQKAFKMGYVGVRETIHMLQGKDVEKSIDSGCELVTQENMYTSENEKLLFPFNSIRQNSDIAQTE